MVITLYISTLTHSAILHIALPPEAYGVRSSVKRDMRTIEQALYVARGYHLLRWAMHKVRSVDKSYAIGKRQRYVEFVRGEYHTLTLVVCQTAQQQITSKHRGTAHKNISRKAECAENNSDKQS